MTHFLMEKLYYRKYHKVFQPKDFYVHRNKTEKTSENLSMKDW